MVGLTAVDYLVTHAETSQIGHVRAHGLPDVTPFADGVPRHPTRLYDVAGVDATVLLSEVFLPVGAAEPFVDGLLSFVEEAGIEEVTVVYGVPFPHGPDEHAVFSVATDRYRERTLADTGITPLRGGFFDGLVGEVVARGLDEDGPAVGVLVTPSHPPGPDLDAAILVLDAVETLFGVEVDEAELRSRADEIRRQYLELADRIQSLGDADLPLSAREYPEDRMFM
jgi:uncharacterized protein